jgi:multidrug efflux pump
MTTAATVVGHFPLILASGPGAGARNSIGIMLVSGMIIGTLFTLFVVPSIYVLVARTHVAAAAETGFSGPAHTLARPGIDGFDPVSSPAFAPGLAEQEVQ